MDLSKQFNPIPKPQREKPKPKFKNKRHKTTRKKQKKVERYKGVTIPPRKVRSSITKTEYQRAIEAHGENCFVCSSYPIEMHHSTFRSQGGRGGFRNLLPLCKTCHSLAHTKRQVADSLRDYLKTLYGNFYYLDRFDLFKMGAIERPTEELFERFMRKEEERAKMGCREESYQQRS